jgi:transposase
LLLRQQVVQLVRSGQSKRSVACRFNVSDKFIRRWCVRAGNQRIDRVDWSDHRKKRKKTHNRTSLQVERCIVKTRKYLHDKSTLGEYGAQAIYREMQSKKCPFIPSLRTINLVLKRQGCIDGKHRIRHKSPPLGWYLPDVASGDAELDSFDYVEDLRLEGDNGFVNVFNGISLHGGLVCSFPLTNMSAENTVNSILEHWRQFGVPTYAQFDNSTVFTGPRHRNCIGRVIRFCLSLGVIPVFVPPYEMGFQANIERYNGLWQKGVWERFHFKNRKQLIEQSQCYVEAYRDKKYDSIQSAPDRYEIPDNYIFCYDNLLSGQIFFIKRTDENGCVNVLGNHFKIDKLWTHRLVRVEINLIKHIIDFYRLRKREPNDQPRIKTKKFTLQ